MKTGPLIEIRTEGCRVRAFREGELAGEASWDAPSPWGFDFDVFVLPSHQGGTMGYLLTREALQHRPPEVIRYRTAAIHPAMTALLTRFFGFRVVSMGGDDEGLYCANLEWATPQNSADAPTPSRPALPAGG